MARLVVTAAILLAAVGCGGAADPPFIDARPGGDVQLSGGTWLLVDGRVDGRAVDVPDGARVTLTVDGDHVGGTAACNRYGGDLTVGGADVAITGIHATQMGCDQARHTAEDAYLDGLARVTAAERRADRLELTGDGVRLAFDLQPPVPDVDLVGVEWVLDTLVRGEVASTAGGDTATLWLGEDGTLRGGTGCRALTGRYVFRGDEVLLSELAADGECPQELADQDALVTAVLGDGFRAAVDGRRLVLTSVGGLGLGYTARG